MRGFRIGRIQEPWINFVPPIRGGIFRPTTSSTTSTPVTVHTPPEEPETESSGSDLDDSVWSSKGSTLGSRTSSYTDLDLEVKLAKATVTEISCDEEALSVDDSPDCIRRTPFIADESDNLDVALEKKPCVSEDITKLSRAAYTIGLEQKEIDNDIRDYPSLDADTQRAIIFDYRALHEKIKSEGFYDCRYSEYGKDCIRFAVLFSIFIFFLQAKWYLTSACFLGLFWVWLLHIYLPFPR